MTINPAASEAYCYIAKHDCGGWFCVVVDVPRAMEDGSKELAQCMRQGHVVERMLVSDFRNQTVPACKCEKL